MLLAIIGFIACYGIMPALPFAPDKRDGKQEVVEQTALVFEDQKQAYSLTERRKGRK